jgi:hypothetical protein
MYSTFLIHKITGWKRCDNVSVYTRRWWLLAMFALSGFVQNIVWNTWGPIAQSAKEVFGWSDGQIGMQKWHIFLHYTNNRPRPFHCTELHNHILFWLNILTITRHVFIYINKSIYRELVLYMLTTRYQSINKANYHNLRKRFSVGVTDKLGCSQTLQI